MKCGKKLNFFFSQVHTWVQVGDVRPPAGGELHEEGQHSGLAPLAALQSDGTHGGQRAVRTTTTIVLKNKIKLFEVQIKKKKYSNFF